MCRVLDVKEQAFYKWRKNPPQKDKLAKEQALRDKIKIIHAESHKTYGRTRIDRELKDQGVVVNHKKISRIMREENLVAKAAKKFKATTDSAHSNPTAPNILDRNFVATEPNQKWVGDITYIWTDEGWLYLATVIDLFSRRIVGWSISNRINAQIVCDALNMALTHRKLPTHIIFHSDRGVQYTCNDFTKLLKSNSFTGSMSRKGNCWDNAVAESFFHSLKVEAIHGVHFRTRKEAQDAIFFYIEGFYNSKRRHSFNNYMSPVNFEIQFETNKMAA